MSDSLAKEIPLSIQAGVTGAGYNLTQFALRRFFWSSVGPKVITVAITAIGAVGNANPRCHRSRWPNHRPDTSEGGSRYEDGFDRGRGSDAIENVRAKRARGKTEEYACRSGRLLLGPHSVDD